MHVVTHRNTEELLANLADVQSSPRDGGSLDLIVARPGEGRRVSLEAGDLTVEDGLVGDDWRGRGSSRTDDGSAHPEMQLTLMNRRFLAFIARDRSRWPLAGDQLIVDFDLSVDNLQPGQRLAIGSAVVEITAMPHTGCRKFADRFGRDAIAFTATDDGRRLRLRGIYAKVVTSGRVTVGDDIRKL